MRVVPLALGFLLISQTAAAQDESSPSIELGSSRIGGPGLTDSERRRVKSWNEPAEYLTEESIAAPGTKKRLPHLHVLANRYVGSKQWKEACTKYDTISDEFQSEGVKQHPDGARNASRAYLACARIAARSSSYDKAEMLLEKSERYGPATPRHESLRLKMVRDQYRTKLTAGDVSTAIKLFKKAQSMDESEDERIYVGDQLAKRAVAAHKSGDTVTRDTMMRHLSEVAPQNTDYRMLKDKLETQAGMFGNVAGAVLAVIVVLLLGSLFMRWKSKRAVTKAMGGPFDDF